MAEINHLPDSVVLFFTHPFSLTKRHFLCRDVTFFRKEGVEMLLKLATYSRDRNIFLPFERINLKESIRVTRPILFG